MSISSPKETIRIVLAEDHHVVRRAVATLLNREADMTVVGEVADGRNLLALVGQVQPTVLLMDAQMPHHEPIEVSKEIRHAYPKVAIVVLSAFDLPEYTVELLKAGAMGYVLKDDASGMLLTAIRAAAGGREWVSPRVVSTLVKWVRGTEQQKIEDILTNRELEVLRLMTVGRRNEEIAAELVISEQTVKNYVTNIFSKLDVETRVEAILRAIAEELVSLETIKAQFPDD